MADFQLQYSVEDAAVAGKEVRDQAAQETTLLKSCGSGWA